LSMSNHILDHNISNRTCLGFIRLGDLAAPLALSGNLEIEGLSVTRPKPVEPIAISGQIGQHDVGDITALCHRENKASIDIGEYHALQYYLHGARTVPSAELNAWRCRRKSAIRHGNIFAPARRRPHVRRDEDYAIIPSFDGAVRDTNVPASIQINAICPYG